MALSSKLFKGVLFNIFAFIALFTPTLILFIYNYDEWVVENSTKISMGAMLGLVYAIFVMKGALKEVSAKTATLISMSIFLAIIWFLDGIIAELFWVVLSVIVGYVLFIIVSAIGNKYIVQYKAYQDEKSRIVARQEAQNDILGV